jgi:hypothetical protein
MRTVKLKLVRCVCDRLDLFIVVAVVVSVVVVVVVVVVGVVVVVVVVVVPLVVVSSQLADLGTVGRLDSGKKRYSLVGTPHWYLID